MPKIKLADPKGDNNNYRTLSPKRFNGIEKSYSYHLNQNYELSDSIIVLEKIISSKQIEIPSEKEGEDPTIKNLTSPEVKAFKAKLTLTKLQQKKTKLALNSWGKKYSSACTTNSRAAKGRMKTINSQIALKREIKKNAEGFQKDILAKLGKLKEKKDHRIAMLKDVAMINGKDFNSQLNVILRNELKDTYSLLNKYPQVKTQIYRSIRETFGWEKNK